MKEYWVREYKCNNPDCCDGYPLIQVYHTIDTKTHYCTFCGVLCEYVGDVVIEPKEESHE